MYIIITATRSEWYCNYSQQRNHMPLASVPPQRSFVVERRYGHSIAGLARACQKSTGTLCLRRKHYGNRITHHGANKEHIQPNQKNNLRTSFDHADVLKQEPSRLLPRLLSVSISPLSFKNSILTSSHRTPKPTTIIIARGHTQKSFPFPIPSPLPPFHGPPVVMSWNSFR